MAIDMTELYNAVAVAKKECTDSYALAYLDAIDTSGTYYGHEGIRTQLLYILNNMHYWRGATARETKAVFKKYIKLLK
jgi:hypothetical protein